MTRLPQLTARELAEPPAARAPRLLRSVVVAVALGAVVTAVLVAAADPRATLATLARFPWRLAPAIIGAVLLNYTLRFLKWHLYLRRLGIALAWPASVAVFVAGFTMSITPGKLGELLKALLVRRLIGTEVSRTASVVMAERLTDVAGLLVLGALGVTALPRGPALLGVVAAAVALAVLAFRMPALARLVRRALPERLARIAEPLRRFVGAGRALLAPDLLASAVALSVISWFFEGVALYLILSGLGTPLPLRAAIGLYALALLVGAVSMLPGGLGAAEGSLAGLLAGAGVPLPDAAAATLLIRAATLWLAVGLGAAVLVLAFRGDPGAAEPGAA